MMRMRRELAKSGVWCLTASLAVTLFACGDSATTQAAEARLRQISNDPIVSLAFAGRSRVTSYSNHGRKTSGANIQHPVTLIKDMQFQGDATAIANSISGSVRKAGWIATASCVDAPSSYIVRGEKRFDGYVANLEIIVNSHPDDRDQQLHFEITAPFPGEEPVQQLLEQAPTCLDE